MVPPISLAAIRHAHPPSAQAARPWPSRALCAAVALLLAGDESRLSLAMILRAEREGDPWSGQMALPGGRADPADAGPQAVAERETAEEIGIVLHRSQLIGALPDHPVRRGGVDIGMTLYPFVYSLGAAVAPFRLNREVAAAYWVPLEHLADPGHWQRHQFRRDGRDYDFPAIGFDGHVIWGVTYRVLAAFFAPLGVVLPP